MSQDDKSIRCSGCKKQIAKGFIIHGRVEIKCKCGVTTTIANEPKRKEEHHKTKENDTPKVKTGMILGEFGIDHRNETSE